MKKRIDEVVCLSIREAVSKIQAHPSLGHNVVQGRLHDIGQLTQLLLQDLKDGVYGTEKEVKRHEV